MHPTRYRVLFRLSPVATRGGLRLDARVINMLCSPKIEEGYSLRKLSIFILSFLLIVVLLICTVWFIVTQPVLTFGKSKPTIDVDTSRLEKHVRRLSEKLVPRDYIHTENLDSAANYIMKEFTQTNGIVSQQPYIVDIIR